MSNVAVSITSHAHITDLALSQIMYWKSEPEKSATVLVEACGLGAEKLLSDLPELVTLEALESLPLGPELLEYSVEYVVAKQEATRIRQEQVASNAASNRVRYLPTGVGFVKPMGNGEFGRQKIEVDPQVRSSGLLPTIAEHMGLRTERYFTIPLVNTMRPVDMAKQLRKAMEGQGYYIAAERLAWDTTHPLWPWVVEAFEKNAVTFSGYNRRLGAPILPEGFMPSTTVRFTTIKTSTATPRSLTNSEVMDYISKMGPHEYRKFGYDAEGNELGPKDLFMKLRGELQICDEFTAGADGSGRYHPDATTMRQFVAKYGAVTCQVTMINDKGLFAKGILVPDERCISSLGVPEVWFDHLQVKGAASKEHKELRAENRSCYRTGHIGLLRAWHTPGKGRACYELLENFRWHRQANEPLDDFKARQGRVKELLQALVTKGLERLVKGGTDALLSQIAQDDPKMKQILMLLLAAKSEGIEVDPLSIPMVAEALDDRFKKALWHLAQGAGLYGKRYAVCIDNAVAPGTCVLSGFPVGAKLATWRFPIVLAQGLVGLTNQEPLPHHIVRGRIVPFTVFMNEQDIVLGQQGDDDGDDIYVTDNPVLLELYGHKLSVQRYRIETKGEKKFIDMFSEEGRAYCASNPQGAVGAFTIYHSELLAVNDLAGARAMAVAIQCAIDQLKRWVLYPDLDMLLEISNWWKREDGTYQALWTEEERPGVPCKNYLKNQEIDYAEYAGDWTTARLELRGCNKKFYQSPLGWRKQRAYDENGEILPGNYAKQITLPLWVQSRARQNGCIAGNTVHYVHDLSWQQSTAALAGISYVAKPVDLRELLPKLLESKGIVVEPTNLSWDQYLKGYRFESGLRKFNYELRQSMQSESILDDINIVELLTLQLDGKLRELVNKHGLQCLVDIWRMETSGINTETSRASVNNAFRAIMFNGSPIMSILGMAEESCTFFDAEKLMRVANQRAAKEDPIRSLLAEIYTVHEFVEGGARHYDRTGLQLFECRTCVDKLVDAVIRRVRAMKANQDLQALKELVNAVNTQVRSEILADAPPLDIGEYLELPVDQLMMFLNSLECDEDNIADVRLAQAIRAALPAGGSHSSPDNGASELEPFPWDAYNVEDYGTTEEPDQTYSYGTGAS